MRPTPGRMVHYVSKIGDGVISPAVVLRTREFTVDKVIERWGPEPQTVKSADGKHEHETAAKPDDFVAELPDDYTVDLLVHGLGKDYREYAVPFNPPGEGGAMPGTWHWPKVIQR